MAEQRLLDIYRLYCVKLIVPGLQNVVGQPMSVVTDLAQYQSAVVEAIWNMLPLPLRLMGREPLRWDEFFGHLRTEVFLAVEGRLALRADVEARLATLVERLFGAETAVGASPAAAVVPAAAPARTAGPPKPALGIPVGPRQARHPIAPPIPTAAPASPPVAVPVTGPGAPLSGRSGPSSLPSPPPIAPPASPPLVAAPTTAPTAAAVPGVAPPNSRTPDEAAPEIAIGIDLGTTYSVVAHIDSHGRPCSIPNAAGEILTPSVVLFDDAGPIVGKEAVLASALEPDRIAECVKRDMGAKFYRKTIKGTAFPPEVISSLILKSLKNDAERKLGPVRNAVITVPAYFDEKRRRATIEAGRLAGLEVLDIINEPTAAAIAYGYQLGFLDATGKAPVDRPLRVLVYDLGGGTFDVTIVEIQGTSFRAIATDGDVQLGGKDWDEKIIDLAVAEFMKQTPDDPRHDPVTMQELWLAAETCKKTLSERPKAAMFVNHLGRRLKVDITREQFEEATAPLLARTRTTTEIVVRQAGLNWSAIDKVLLVGGSTRMPQVQHMLEELTGKPPERSVAVDEAVAHGAALYAQLILSRRQPAAASPKFSITNINSHSLGIVGTDPTTGRRRAQVLIPKNTPLPAAVTKVFKTHKAGQQAVVIRVVEGESERPEACIQVGTCTIGGLPPGLPAGSPVTVTYAYHADGRLEVTGELKGVTAAVTTTFQREDMLNESDMKKWSRYVDLAHLK